MDPAFAEASGQLARTCARLQALVEKQKQRLRPESNGDAQDHHEAKADFVAEAHVRRAVEAYRQDLLQSLRDQIAALDGELAEMGAGLEHSVSDALDEQRESKKLRQDLADVQDKLEELEAARDTENELQAAVRESGAELEKLGRAVRDGLRASASGKPASAGAPGPDAVLRQAELLQTLGVDAVPGHGDPVQAVKDELEAALTEMDEMLRHQEPETHRRLQEYQQTSSRLDSLVRSCCPDYDRLNDPDVLTCWKTALHEAAKETASSAQVLKLARASLTPSDLTRLQTLVGLPV